MTSPAHIILPPPISTNHLFANVAGRGRVLSQEYKDWKQQASGYLTAQSPLPKFTVPVLIRLLVGEKGIGNMDSDNTTKAAIDALKQAGVIKDDSRKWVRSSGAIWIPGLRGMVARIELATAGTMTADDVRQLVPRGLWELLR